MKKHTLFTFFVALSASAVLLTGCGKSDGDEGDNPGGKPKPNYDLVNFPKGSQPQEIGEGLTKRFIGLGHSFWGNITSDKVANHITYPDVCNWLGALWFTQSVNNDKLYGELVTKFDKLFDEEKHLQPSLTPSEGNKVDFYVFGSIPLEIYKKRKDNKYTELGMKYADGQWTLPGNASQTEKDWHNQGYSWQTRLWIDDMFMITALQAQAYQATGDEKYIERTAKEMVLYLERLQRDNGLFYHAPNVPFYWGRGDGWMAVGMADVLRILPKTPKYDTYRAKIMAGYLKMMEALYRHQSPSGLWGQLIDSSTIWRETSGSAMFTYAMIVGVKNGWLDEQKYGAAARKAWLSLLEYLDSNYDIRNVCEGTGAQNSYKYYVDRKKLTGDMHGQAGLLWCAYALMTPAQKN